MTINFNLWICTHRTWSSSKYLWMCLDPDSKWFMQCGLYEYGEAQLGDNGALKMHGFVNYTYKQL